MSSKGHLSNGTFAKGNRFGVAGRKAFKHGGKGGSLQRANALLDSSLPKVVKSVIESAIAGDMVAARMIMDKKMPSLRSIEVTGMDADKLPRMIIQGNIIEAQVIEDKTGEK